MAWAIAMTDEYDIGFHLKRIRVLEASWGGTCRFEHRFATVGSC